MKLTPEYIKFLKNEIKAFNKELLEIKELPSIESLRARIKKDKRDAQSMLSLYAQMLACNIHIKAVKSAMKACNQVAMDLLGYNLQRPRRKYDSTRDTSYDF